MEDKPHSAYETVTVARYATGLEAEMAAAKLRANGIPAEVEPYSTHDMLGHMHPALAPMGIAVLVSGTVAVHAEEVLAASGNGTSTGDSGSCGEADDTCEFPIEEDARRACKSAAYSWLVLALLSPLALVRLAWVLRSYLLQRGQLPQDVRRRVERSIAIGLLFSLLGTAMVALMVGLVVYDNLTHDGGM